MAVTTTKSTQVTAHDAGTMVPSYSGVGELVLIHFDVDSTTAGDANSLISLAYLPAGTFRFNQFLSKLYFSAFGTARTMDIGWTAYTEEDGTAAVADEDGLTAAADVSSAGSLSPGAALTSHPVGEKVFSSQSGILFQAKIEAAALGAGETVSGWLAFTK